MIVVAGLFAAVGVHLKLTYDKAIRDAETLITALAIAEEQHIGGSLAGIDALLEELAAAVRDGRYRDAQFSREFAARLPSFPEIRFIAIADASGRLQPQSWPPQPFAEQGVDISGRRYFTAQREATGPSAMVVGDPVVGLGSGERTLHLSRPVRNRAGAFVGVVLAAVNPDVYAEFLGSILYDEAGSCGLISSDGRMIARAPNHIREFGRDISDSDLIRLWVPRSPVGVAHLIARTDGNDKLLAYRVMPEFSLMATAGVSRAKALGPWRSMAVAEIILLAVFSSMLLYWARRIRRQDGILGQQQRLMEEAVEQRSRELEQARTMAEDRAARLEWINDELKRLTLVTSHHLQEPVRSVVSCGQMLPRSLSPCPPELEQAVEALSREGLGLKGLLSRFEKHVAALTGTLQAAEAVAALDAPLPATPAPAAQDRPVYAARSIAAAVILALLAGTGWQIRMDYQAALISAATLTNAVVNSIERHFVSSFRRIDNLLTDVAWAVEDGRHTDNDFRERLLARLQTLAEVRQISVTDATGRSTPWNWSVDAAPLSLRNTAERDFFKIQAAEDRHGLLVVGQPRRDDANRERLLPLSHPLIAPDGSFAGVVVALVEADLYARFLDTVLLDEDGGSAVLTLKGRIVARAPKHEEKFGMDVSGSDLFTEHLPRSTAGIARLTSKADGNDKLMGYRVIHGFPLVVTSGYSDRRALSQWSTLATVSAVMAAIASATLFAWAWRADRHSRAMGRYRRELAAEVARRTAGLTAAHRAADLRSNRLALANGQMQELIRMIGADMQAPLARLGDCIAKVETLAAGRNDECDHWLAFITTGGTHLRALLRDYQRFVSTLSDCPRRREVDCAEIAHGAAAMITTAWKTRVSFHIGVLPRLAGDPDMLLELFLQLFANAAVHAARERPATVRVEAEPEGTGWHFAVIDDGPGLPPINSEQLFRAFETAHNRDPDSTGLGLPLCRVIVQAHGGRIWLTSRPRKGCEVHFVLPDDPAARFPLAGNSAPA